MKCPFCGDESQPAGGPLLRVGIDPDQRAAGGGRDWQDPPGGSRGSGCRESAGAMPLLRVPAPDQRPKEKCFRGSGGPGPVRIL